MLQRYIVRRLLLTFPLLILVSFGSFCLILITPGDPAEAALGLGSSQEEIQELREELGLDRHFLIQYIDWLGSALQGDFGESVTYHQSVSGLLKTRIGPTLWLAGGSLLVTLLIGIPAGALAGANRNSWFDRAINLGLNFGLAIPDFFIGALLVFIFAVQLHWLPSSGFVDPLDDPVDGIKHLVLPWIALSALSTTALARMVRSGMLDVMSEDYILTAHAKGLSAFVVVQRHALRNAFLSSLTLLGLILRQLVGGAVVVEVLFSIPGTGQLLVNAVIARDFPVVQAVVLYIACGIVLINLFVDLAYGFVDPRVSYS